MDTLANFVRVRVYDMPRRWVRKGPQASSVAVIQAGKRARSAVGSVPSPRKGVASKAKG
jgi:hypothetical protein